MHRGNPYPYHPTYWATEAWFFPGYVPWKLRLAFYPNNPPPWLLFPFGQSYVTEAGVVDDPADTIAYTMRTIIDGALVILQIGLWKEVVNGTPWAVWGMELEVAGQLWSRAGAKQLYPQRVVACDEFDFSIPMPPYQNSDPPLLNIRPATYAEGGSPWSL
jgi:hypothetical protein